MPPNIFHAVLNTKHIHRLELEAIVDSYIQDDFRHEGMTQATACKNMYLVAMHNYVASINDGFPDMC